MISWLTTREEKSRRLRDFFTESAKLEGSPERSTQMGYVSSRGCNVMCSVVHHAVSISPRLSNFPTVEANDPPKKEWERNTK